MPDIWIAILSNQKKVITLNILRDCLIEIQSQHDTNMDAAEQKHSGNIVIITGK